MSVCILSAGKTIMIAASAFTLSWTHSAEKTQWQESWLVAPAGLQIVSARIQGSGAGMEPPEGSEFKDGWWVYEPMVGPQRQLVLASSGATGAGWSLCAAGSCLTLGATAGQPVVIRLCRAGDD